MRPDTTARDMHLSFYDTEIRKKHGATDILCHEILDDNYISRQDFKELYSLCREEVEKVQGKVRACMASNTYPTSK